MARSMVRGLEPPTATDYRARELDEIVTQLKADFAKRDELYQYIDGVVFGELPVNIPKAYRKTALEVRSPLATHIINTVTAALSVNPQAIAFEPVGFGEVHQQNSTLREHFFEASWRRQEEEAKERLLRLFLGSLVVKGEGILKTMERSKRAWAKYDRYQHKRRQELDRDDTLDQDSRDRIYDRDTEDYKRNQPYPIATSLVQPESFYYLKGEDGFTVNVEDTVMPYLEALSRFNCALDRNGKVRKRTEDEAKALLDPAALGNARAEWGQIMGSAGGAKTVRLKQVWTWDEVNYILVGPGDNSSQSGRAGAGTLVRTLAHGYGDADLKTLRGPYFHALGTTTTSRLPERAGLSILYGFLDLFPLLDSLLTIEGNAAFTFGFPAYKRNAKGGGDVGDALMAAAAAQSGLDGSEGESEDHIEPGDVLPYDVSPIDQPRTGIVLDSMMGQIRGFLELALPSVVQGAVSGDESGYALNQAAYMARLAWDPIIDNAQFALGERVGFESWLLENRIREDVYVWGEPAKDGKRSAKAGWLNLGPDDLKGVHRYKVKLNPETPSTKVIDQRYHEGQVKNGFESLDMAREAMGNNPDEVELGILYEALKQSLVPDVLERARQKIGTFEAKKVQGDGSQVDVMQAEQMQQMQGQQTSQDAIGQVYQPGQNGMPMQGMEPGGSGPLPAGMPGGIPNAPQNATALPGQ